MIVTFLAKYLPFECAWTLDDAKKKKKVKFKKLKKGIIDKCNYYFRCQKGEIF